MIYFVKLCRMTKHLFGPQPQWGPQPHRWPPYKTFAERVKSAKRCRCARCLLKWCSSDVIFSDRVVVECRVWCWLRSLSLKKKKNIQPVWAFTDSANTGAGVCVRRPVCVYMHVHVSAAMCSELFLACMLGRTPNSRLPVFICTEESRLCPCVAAAAATESSLWGSIQSLFYFISAS